MKLQKKNRKIKRGQKRRSIEDNDQMKIKKDQLKSRRRRDDKETCPKRYLAATIY